MGEAKTPEPPRQDVTDLGGGSEVIYIPRFVDREKAWEWFDYLDKSIPWTSPEIRVFGRSANQVRDASISHFLHRVRSGTQPLGLFKRGGPSEGDTRIHVATVSLIPDQIFAFGRYCLIGSGSG